MWGVQLVFELHTLHVLQLAVPKVCTLRELVRDRNRIVAARTSISRIQPFHNRSQHINGRIKAVINFYFFSLASNIIFKYNYVFRYL
jgi:hypothetical protein